MYRIRPNVTIIHPSGNKYNTSKSLFDSLRIQYQSYDGYKKSHWVYSAGYVISGSGLHKLRLFFKIFESITRVLKLRVVTLFIYKKIIMYVRFFLFLNAQIPMRTYIFYIIIIVIIIKYFYFQDILLLKYLKR